MSGSIFRNTGFTGAVYFLYAEVTSRGRAHWLASQWPSGIVFRLSPGPHVSQSMSQHSEIGDTGGFFLHCPLQCLSHLYYTVIICSLHEEQSQNHPYRVPVGGACTEGLTCFPGCQGAGPPNSGRAANGFPGLKLAKYALACNYNLELRYFRGSPEECLRQSLSELINHSVYRMWFF